MLSIRKILYPTDFSSFCTPAYFHAVTLAENHKASLAILYVYNPSDSDQPSNRQYWRDQLEQIRPTNESIPVQHVLLEGDPAQAIVQYAGDSRTDLIVMGTHGQTGTDTTLMGSVAEQVMRDAPCSVLVVKLHRGRPAVETPHIARTTVRT